MPEEVDWGVVPGPGMFVADPARGADFEMMEPDVEREYREAALATADALRHALARTFLTRPGGRDEES